jgi:acyl dehydratase
MRLMVDYRRRSDEVVLARGERVGHVGPSTGFRDLKWLKPVYVGDTIDYYVEVTGIRPSNSRPEYGLMTLLATGTNQKGDLVISFESTSFVERRSNDS